MTSGVEIIDFCRPDSNRKNLFVTNIPSTLCEDEIVVKLRDVFEQYGLICGVQVYPAQWKPKYETDQNAGELTGCFYAFVTFYSAMEAARAKDDLRGVLMLADSECKVAYAKRKKDVVEKIPLYFKRCYELVNHYLGFNSWSTEIKTLFEDKENIQDTEHTRTVKYVCLAELTVTDLKTEGVGVWQESYSKTDPMSKIQATCKCKKLCHQRAIENAFSRVLLIYLCNGKVAVEIDTTKPEFRTEIIQDDHLIKVNELDDQPESEADVENESEISMSSKLSASELDDINLQLLQELEEDM